MNEIVRDLPPNCNKCSNDGYTIDLRERGGEIYCKCEWGIYLAEKDDSGSMLTLRAYILSGGK